MSSFQKDVGNLLAFAKKHKGWHTFAFNKEILRALRACKSVLDIDYAHGCFRYFDSIADAIDRIKEWVKEDSKNMYTEGVRANGVPRNGAGYVYTPECISELLDNGDEIYFEASNEDTFSYQIVSVEKG